MTLLRGLTFEAAGLTAGSSGYALHLYLSRSTYFPSYQIPHPYAMTDVAEAPPVPSTSAQPTIDASSATTHSPGTRQLEPEHAPPLENPEWGLKEILWPPEVWENQPQRRVRIVTQNANGPCSFIAICTYLTHYELFTYSKQRQYSYITWCYHHTTT